MNIGEKSSAIFSEWRKHRPTTVTVSSFVMNWNMINPLNYVTKKLQYQTLEEARDPQAETQRVSRKVNKSVIATLQLPCQPCWMRRHQRSQYLYNFFLWIEFFFHHSLCNYVSMLEKSSSFNLFNFVAEFWKSKIVNKALLLDVGYWFNQLIIHS